MAFKEYADYDGVGLGKLVAKRQVKPAELVDEAIRRAERLNPKLNAIIYEAFDTARETAKGKLPKGAFSGVPFLLKDIQALAIGMPTRQGARFLPAIPSDHDSEITTRFRKAGLVIMGTTNVPEFGLVPTTEGKLYGPARNPWNPERSTGGSSGGSAAAVAAGIVPLAHANDGGGSIRIPASCCGLVGLKPTRARVSLAPDVGDIMSGLTADLVVSRTVRDTAAALDALQGPVMGDPYWAPPTGGSYLAGIARKPKRLRIAVATTHLDGKKFHPDCAAAMKTAARVCEELGHIVEEGSPVLDQRVLIPAFMGIWSSGLAMFVDLIGQLTGRAPNPMDFEGLTWGLYEAGKKVTAAQYLTNVFLMQRAARDAARFHETFDAWITPTLGAPPLKLGTLDLDERDPQKAFAPIIDYVPFTAMQNATGQPAINLPLHWNKEGLPIGVQFVGRFGDEMTLLKLAAQIEKAQPWAAKRPKIR